MDNLQRFRSVYLAYPPAAIYAALLRKTNAVRAPEKYAIVAPRWEADALHVAVATASLCPAIASWNFKHIVNFRRIPLYNGVNLAHGFQIAIHTPQEVVSYDDEDDPENVCLR